MSTTSLARQLRQHQTEAEKQLWRALKAGRFAGFKFRRQHPIGPYFLDFYCPKARLAVELDGFHHGLPDGLRRDRQRDDFMMQAGILVLRYWNHQWRSNRDGVLLEIWHALYTRTGSVKLPRKEQNQKFVPPAPEQIQGAPMPLPRRRVD